MHGYWDVKKLIDRFGGPTKMCTAFAKAGYEPPSVGAIQKWVERRSIPSDRLAEIIKIARRSRMALRLSDYLYEEAPDFS